MFPTSILCRYDATVPAHHRQLFIVVISQNMLLYLSPEVSGGFA
jgi:hypothetical protein